MKLTIQALRDSIKSHSLIRLGADYNIDDQGNQEDINAHVLDVQTAHCMITVYDALTEPRQKEKFEKLLMNQPATLAGICWRLIK